MMHAQSCSISYLSMHGYTHDPTLYTSIGRRFLGGLGLYVFYIRDMSIIITNTVNAAYLQKYDRRR